MKTTISNRNVILRISLGIVAIFLYSGSLYAQDKLSVEQFNPAGPGKKKICRDIQAWAESQTLFKITYNNKADTIVAEGSIPYINPVKFEGSATYARMYTEQSNGSIVFKVWIICMEDGYTVRIGNFLHKPQGKGDKIEFGILTISGTAPSNLVFDYDEKWCNLVWEDMKNQAIAKAKELISGIPAQMTTAK
jgi:hypothetical protein